MSSSVLKKGEEDEFVEVERAGLGEGLD